MNLRINFYFYKTNNCISTVIQSDAHPPLIKPVSISAICTPFNQTKPAVLKLAHHTCHMIASTILLNRSPATRTQFSVLFDISFTSYLMRRSCTPCWSLKWGICRCSKPVRALTVVIPLD